MRPKRDTIFLYLILSISKLLKTKTKRWFSPWTAREHQASREVRVSENMLEKIIFFISQWCASFVRTRANETRRTKKYQQDFRSALLVLLIAVEVFPYLLHVSTSQHTLLVRYANHPHSFSLSLLSQSYSTHNEKIHNKIFVIHISIELSTTTRLYTSQLQNNFEIPQRVLLTFLLGPNFHR